MALKELSVKEALQLLAEKYPEPVEGYLLDSSESYPLLFKLDYSSIHRLDKYRFAIEVPNEYRYMTQQECIDWACLHGYEGYQVKYKGEKTWYAAGLFGYCDSDIPNYEYRTIQEIDGKIVYGESQEFKVKVEE
jgi:hypothetical protein